MFFDESNGLNNLDRGLQKGHICYLLLESVQWFIIRKFFKFFIKIYRENKPAPSRPCFLTNHNGLNNLDRGLPKGHTCYLILESVKWFIIRNFFKFFIKIYRENEPRSLAAMFFHES